MATSWTGPHPTAHHTIAASRHWSLLLLSNRSLPLVLHEQSVNDDVTFDVFAVGFAYFGKSKSKLNLAPSQPITKRHTFAVGLTVRFRNCYQLVAKATEYKLTPGYNHKLDIKWVP